MATNRTMMMAMGKLGKKSSSADDGPDGAPSKGGDYGSEDHDAGEEDEETDDKKTAFVDMCKAIKSGDYDNAYELYEDLCEGM